MIRNAIASLLIVLAVCAGADAQDHGPIGVVVAYPGSIGAHWDLSEGVAIRPDFSFAFGSSDSSSNSQFGGALASSNDRRSFEVGVSALFYLKRWDALRTYVSPRFAYGRETTSSDSAASPGGVGEIRNHVSDYITSGSIGAQYTLGQRFAVFGEAGVAYTHSQGSLSGSAPVVFDTSGWTVASRAGVGAVVYF